MLEKFQLSLLLLLTTIISYGYAQKIVVGEGVTHYYTRNGHKFIIARISTPATNDISYAVTLDSTRIDTIDFAFTPVAMFQEVENHIFLISNSNNRQPTSHGLHQVSLHSGNSKLSTTSKASFSGIIADKVYGISNSNYSEEGSQLNETLSEGTEEGIPLHAIKKDIISYDPTTKEEEVIFNADNFINNYSGGIYKLYFSPGNKLLIVLGDTEDGAIYYDFHYFLYDINTLSVSKINLSDLSEDEAKYGINYGDIYPDFSSDQYLISTKGILLDGHFQKVGSILRRSQGAMRGYNYEGDSIVSINLSSQLDVRKYQEDTYQRVIIDFLPSHILEKALYAIYRNQALSAYDLAQLDSQQLRLVKNMIYARHNYQFDSPYYQAFFNLFDFYNTEAMRQRRTKTMEGQLTRHDVQNARLIKQIMDRRE